MSARAIIAACAAIVVASCASQGPTAGAGAGWQPSPGSTAIALQNPGFEEPTRPGEICAVNWNCTMHNDPFSFRFFHDEGGGTSGARGYCIESVGREPWGRMSQVFGMEKAAPLRGAHVKLSVAMKLDAVTSGTAGPLLIAQGGSGQLLGNAVNLQPARNGWQRLETEMDVPAGTFLLEMGILLQGKGKVCFDDVRLERAVKPAGPV
ncbi:MAG TPA: hypothetical protein VKR38_02145 [Usitatibacter sp.]|nr:hypothetical protein [Usitatibacter sp.]